MEGDYLSCTAGNAMLGIDVSVYQGQIDWQKVAAAGVEFVFVRLGYRGYETGLLHTDKRAVENLQGAKEAGLLVGAYFYSQAVNVMEAQEEARYALDVLGDFQLDLPLVYDWEYVSETARAANVSKITLTECTIAFCEAVKNAGCEPMIYFNSNQAKRQLDMEKLERYSWWLAMYNLENEMICKVDAWQYSYTGRVNGISTTVDLNLMFTDYGIGSVFAKTGS
jgi:GH25 family lysozyme M1 (1,4-beta-N-acetylmuramidase)